MTATAIDLFSPDQTSSIEESRPTTRVEPKPGRERDLIANRFRILRLVSQSNRATVYRAFDEQLRIWVAVRVSAPSELREPREFLRQAQAVAQSQSQGIARHVGHGILPGGKTYVATEWVPGRTLRQHLDSAKRCGVEETLALVKTLCDALAPLHRAGVVHGELRPSNVLLPWGRFAQASLVDFAMDAPRCHAPWSTGPTVTDPQDGYQAPEQIAGLDEAGPWTDVFSLGCIAYHCLTGRLPFAGGGFAESLHLLLLKDVPPVSSLRPEVGPELDDLIACMLAKDPVERFQDARDVARALQPHARSGVYPTLG